MVDGEERPVSLTVSCPDTGTCHCPYSPLQETAWKWRFGRRWAAEQAKQFDPEYGRQGGDEDGWDEALGEAKCRDGRVNNFQSL